MEILEYPSWNQYIQELKKGWDAVGFSFYMNEVTEILKMVKAAREAGVESIWAGNYGIMSKEIQSEFDRIILGYGEEEVGKYFGREIKELIHPPLCWPFGTTMTGALTMIGQLCTVRGCSFQCNFCQAPSFCNKLSKLPLESIERILKYYNKIGVNMVNIVDENFCLYKSHTEQVIELSGKYEINWYPCMRPNGLSDDLDYWIDNDFLGAQIGFESMSSKAIESAGKNFTLDHTYDIVFTMKEKNWLILGFYMLGFEDDTAESIKQDVKRLASFKLNLHQICVMTPLPETPLWEHLDENYRIFEKDYHKFDAKHLVWNHPNISPQKMRELLAWSFNETYPRHFPARYVKQFYRAFRYNKSFTETISLFKNNYKSTRVMRPKELDAYFNPETGRWE